MRYGKQRSERAVHLLSSEQYSLTYDDVSQLLCSSLCDIMPAVNLHLLCTRTLISNLFLNTLESCRSNLRDQAARPGHGNRKWSVQDPHQSRIDESV